MKLRHEVAGKFSAMAKPWVYDSNTVSYTLKVQVKILLGLSVRRVMNACLYPRRCHWAELNCTFSAM